MNKSHLEAHILSRMKTTSAGHTIQPVQVVANKRAQSTASRLAELIAWRCSTGNDDLENLSYAGISNWHLCSLIDFRGDTTALPGRKATKVRGLTQLPGYFLEVKEYNQISSEDMARRFEFAKETGFLILGPDEIIAITHGDSADSDGYVFCDTFENSEQGDCRVLHGIYAASLDYHAKPQRISDLNQTTVKSTLRNTLTELAIRRQEGDISQQQIDRMRKTLDLLSEHEKTAPPEKTMSGAVIKRWFIESGDIDSIRDLRKSAEGWKRYPTSQDAWYLGIWVNDRLKQTISYTEGDVAHIICEDQDQFNNELAAMAEFHGTRRTAEAIGYSPADGTKTHYFSGFYLLGGKVIECVLSSSDAKHDPAFNGGAPLLAAILPEHQSLQALRTGDSIPADKEFFSLDLCSPLAFAPHTATITRCLFGYQIAVNRGVKNHIGLIRMAEEAIA